jgi:HEPN domain-containing protein
VTENAPPLPAEAGQNLFNSLLSVYVQPELVRRAEAGHPLPPGMPLLAIQAVFNVGGDTKVRLNEEVKSLAQMRAARPITKGQSVTTEDIAEITRIDLTDEDPDAAHITALQLGDGWHISWDGRYNASVIAAHIQAGAEFVELAEHAVENGLLRGFVENAFEAAELLAKAEVLALPDERKSKTHGVVASQFNRWARIGNTDQRYAELRNELERLRAPARYLRGEFGLARERADEMLATLKEMQKHADEVAPRRPPAARVR